MTEKERQKEFWQDVTGATVVGAIIFLVVWLVMGCEKQPTSAEDFSYSIPQNATLAKGNEPGIDLVPILLENAIVSAHDLKTYYTGKDAADINQYIIVNPCVVANYGDKRFVSVDSLNWHFILIRGAWLDTTSGELYGMSEYWKNEFQPWGVPIEGFPDSGSGPSGVMKPNTWDMYLEDLPARIGYNVLMIVYNADGRYPEKNVRNNTGYYGYYWWQNPVCGFMGNPDAPLACFNNTVDNKWLTPKIKSALKNMGRGS